MTVKEMGPAVVETAALFSKRYVVHSYPQIMGYFRT
jgi:hypothetical protein